MNDIINNRLDTFRNRLLFLDGAENSLIWNGKPPLKFTEKVETARLAINELTADAADQSAATTGNALDKLREEKELENAAFTLARAFVNCSQDIADETSAAKYDFPISGWRRLRDEALLQKARLLQADATALTAGPQAITATGYGITPASIAAFKKEADDYEAYVAAPAAAISARALLTASLTPKSRAIMILFDQLDDLALQFRGTPSGDAFVTAFLATDPIIPRGHRYEKAPTPPKP